MSSLAFLVTELQSLASETRRKHPEIREAAEKSLAILRASPEQATANLASDGPQSDDLLKPVFMGCATKNAKVVAISLGSLQRLIALRAVPQSAVPLIINTMTDAMSQGVDIQLRILQTLVSLVPNFPDIHGTLLGDALLLCFKLQESRIAVVSSTAAATLRQLVMFVVDKVVLEDQINESNETPSPKLAQVKLPNGSTKKLGPSARDAFSVFEDLCLLANSEKPRFLKLDFLHKTFALELIESVLTNYHELFSKHSELILLLQQHLCPLLLKSLSDRPQFPLSLRCTRVVFLLIKQFSLKLQTESEVFLMMLIRIINEENAPDSGETQPHHSHSSKPPWLRVLAMEIMRGLCSDAELIRNMWDCYDAPKSSSKALASLITALKRLVTEKPAVLGVGSQMGGIGVQPELSSASSAAAYGLDMAGRVASATVSGVVGMIGSGAGGLSLHGSAMKLQCIDQLDKADAPPIPESYIYLLAVQCIVSLCEGFASFSGPIYTNLVMQRPRAPGEAVIRAPPALDLSTLPQNDPQTKQLFIVQSIIFQAWPALLAALSFIIATNLSDELFVEVLASYQAMANVSGMLGLTTPRDAFFNSLSKFAVPSRVVSSLDSYVEAPQTPRSATAALSEGLGLGGPAQPPGLSERNMACLKVLVGCALFFAGSLGDSWYAVLEALQNADFVLVMMGRFGSGVGQSSKRSLFSGGSGIPGGGGGGGGVPPNRSVAGSGSQSHSGNPPPNVIPSKHPLLTDLDVETMQMAIQRLFDSSKNLEDPAFRDFINALCKLSAEMVNMQSDGGMSIVPVRVSESGDDAGSPLNISSENVAQRRRISGIHIPKTTRSGDFGITKLGGVALLNIHRLIYRSPDVAWDTTTSHLLMIIRLPFAPQSIRIQAARVLDEILLIVPRNLSNTGELQAQVQRRVLDALARQVVPDPSVPSHQQTSTSVELRRMGLETLHQILQASGHTLVVGWEIIFQMLESACRPTSTPNISAPVRPPKHVSVDSVTVLNGPPSPVARTRPLPLGLGNPTEKSYSGLVKIAFQSLTLVCDSVSSLSPKHLRLCISTLGQFGRQADTNIALTAAASLLWSVSDVIQSKRKNIDEEPKYSELWMFLLLEVLGLCTDTRAEVRDGAIQTLFRTMQLYGATLSSETWDQCIWKVTFPLLESLTQEIRQLTDPNHDHDPAVDQTWDDSKILALNSIGSIFTDFLVSKIMLLDSFNKAWDVFVGLIEDALLVDHRIISSPALRCLEKAIKAAAAAEGVLRLRVTEVLERVWQAIDLIGSSATRRYNSQADLENSPHQPLTQDSLVAFVDVIQNMRKTGRSMDGKEWSLSRLTRLMVVLKGVLTYPHSPDYRPDIDALPPVQAVVLDTIVDIDLSIPDSSSLVIRDLSEYVTLPFLAAFDAQPNPKNQSLQTPQKRVTYIALSKKTMPMLVELFLRFKTNVGIYVDGTLESVLSAYSIPVKLKYDCPAPSKFGKDPPLWKTATSCFLSIVRESTHRLSSFGPEIPDERIEGIWRQMLDVFRGGILADCSAADSFALDVQESEENFDLALIASLEIDVVPYIGDRRVPDVLVSQLGKILHKGSQVCSVEGESSSISSSGGSSSTSSTLSNSASPPISHAQIIPVGIDERYSDLGTTEFGKLVPRERFSYWCFDLLFLICSDTTKDQEIYRRRLAALSLSSLLNRCRTTLVGYVADECLRGNLPFPRAREEELIYVLRKLLSLRLWPGSLWASLSDNPTEHCISQPSTKLDTPPTPRELVSDSIKRSTTAHLFHFYPVLCEIASIPRHSPTAWVQAPPADSDNVNRDNSRKYGRDDGKAKGKILKKEKKEKSTGPLADAAVTANGDVSGDVVELDARTLARDCLRELGREMGVSS